MKCCEFGPRSLFATLYVLQNLRMDAKKARVFVTGKPFKPSVMKLSYLLGQDIIYDENEVL
jgi:hypothetical protein